MLLGGACYLIAGRLYTFKERNGIVNTELVINCLIINAQDECENKINRISILELNRRARNQQSGKCPLAYIRHEKITKQAKNP